MDPTRWDWTMFQRQGDEAEWLIEDVFGERRRGSSLSALLPVDMFSTDDDVVIQVDVPGIAADHIDLTLQADVVTIRIEPLPDRPAEYTQYLLQWLVTRARIVSPDGAPEALSRLVELERHLPVLAEHALSTVDDLAGLADARLQNLADALSVSTDDLLRWRAEADERRRLGNISLVAYTINPTFIDFDVYEPVAASIQFDGRGMSVIFPPDSDVQHDSAECRTRGDPVDVRPGLPLTLGDWRQMMTRVNEDNKGYYRFQPHNTGDWAVLPALLEEMAEVGADLYTAVFNDTNTAECLRQVMEDRPRTIEVANISRDQVVPWNGLYELPLMDKEEVRLRRTASAGLYALARTGSPETLARRQRPDHLGTGLRHLPTRRRLPMP
jgi:hypothetical protein